MAATAVTPHTSFSAARACSLSCALTSRPSQRPPASRRPALAESARVAAPRATWAWPTRGKSSPRTAHSRSDYAAAQQQTDRPAPGSTGTYRAGSASNSRPSSGIFDDSSSAVDVPFSSSIPVNFSKLNSLNKSTAAFRRNSNTSALCNDNSDSWRALFYSI